MQVAGRGIHVQLECIFRHNDKAEGMTTNNVPHFMMPAGPSYVSMPIPHP